MMYNNPTLFQWLPGFLSSLWACLKGITISTGVSLYSFLLGLCLIVVAVRGIILKR